MRLDLDGSGNKNLSVPNGFLTHMIELFVLNGQIDLTASASGDTYIDEHHIVEDIGIALGAAFAKALDDKRGITRYGFFILPMDEAIATVAIDFSGRSSFVFDCPFTRENVGDLACELVYDFWNAFAQNAKACVYIKVENGRNDHHKIEAIFKAMGRAIRDAVAIDKKIAGEIPSTKGTL